MVNPADYEGRSFKNPYLRQVAFEIKFPSNTRIVNEYYKFQEVINEKYLDYAEDLSLIGLPDNMQPPETMRRFSFITKDKVERIKISINSFTYITSDYSRYDIFSEEIAERIGEFKEIFNIKSVHRIGLRYINVYPLEKDLSNSISKASERFTRFYNTNKFIEEDILNYNVEIRTKNENNIRIMYRARFQYDEKKEEFFHVLDFDTFISDVFSIENLDDKLNELHTFERDEFLKCVSEEFMAEMEFL